MKTVKNFTLIMILALTSFTVISCNDKEEKTIEPQLTPSQILSSTTWETTNAKNNKGEDVTLSDPNVINFVGFAYFKNDGTFTMYNLDDSPKMHGDWSVSPDGKTRTISAKDDAGNELFTRVVDITVLTKEEFTYRVYTNENDKNIYFDIVHTPTDHLEP